MLPHAVWNSLQNDFLSPFLLVASMDFLVLETSATYSGVVTHDDENPLNPDDAGDAVLDGESPRLLLLLIDGVVGWMGVLSLLACSAKDNTSAVKSPLRSELFRMPWLLLLLGCVGLLAFLLNSCPEDVDRFLSLWKLNLGNSKLKLFPESQLFFATALLPPKEDV